MLKFTKAKNDRDYVSKCGRFYIYHPKSCDEPTNLWGLCDRGQFDHFEMAETKTSLVRLANAIIDEE